MNAWVEAARPRTLSAGITPVLVGAAAAGRFIAWRFIAALVVGVSIQIGVNFANDLFDAQRGVDTGARLGPRRAVASGLVSPQRMRIALGITIAVAAVAGLVLALATTLWLLVVGLACFAALLAYSGGPRPYASAGLGEVFVFVFFGLVATIGSAYVQDESISRVAVTAAVPVGLLAVAILVVNNLRDIPTDSAAGKKTLAIRLGEQRTRRLFTILCVAILIGVLVTSAVDNAPWTLLGLFCLLPLERARRVVARAQGRDLVPALGATSAAQLVLGIGLAVGLWIS
ncbi:MAG: 1,4-dihydroxy-2-naphthoate polyprenyltransferase [Actinobacteria bacterium]|nr:1,4-dihydroxy-2-naphthoate polyprenyltransferase [Actinomycetota bacterium]